MLRGPRITLRPTIEADIDALAAVLAEPEVARYWHGFDREKVKAELIDAGDVAVFAIEHEGRVVGAIQYGEEDDPMYRHASVDVFLSAHVHRRGVGTEAIRAIVAHLFDDRGHHRIVIDPAADNAAAIEVYRRVGFRVVGVLRQYERGHDGTWHDGVLMDLLRDEFSPAASRPSRRTSPEGL